MRGLPWISGVLLQPSTESRDRCARAEADRVQHGVARLHASRRRFRRREAVTVVAIRKEDDALAPGGAADQVDRTNGGVVQCGASPGGQQPHGVLACPRILLALGDEERGLVEPDEGGRVSGPQPGQQLLDRRLDVLERLLHAAAHVDGEHEIQRAVLARKGHELLRDPVLQHLEIPSLQAPHEPSAIGDDDGHEHRVYLRTLGVPEVLRPHVVRQLRAVSERGDHADVMSPHDGPGVPRAPERRPLRRAHQPPIHEHADRLDGSAPGDRQRRWASGR